MTIASQLAATNLSVNLNKVALVRNQRDGKGPNVVRAARCVIEAGANGITVHPRQDGRHIRTRDVTDLARLLRDEPELDVEFNVEGYPSTEFVALIRDVAPTQATLVPDSPNVLTSDQGWDLSGDTVAMLRPIIEDLRQRGIRVALFMEANTNGMSHIGANRIELYTGPYAEAFEQGNHERLLASYISAARTARDCGLGVNAGHDLNLDNLPTFCDAIPWLAEVSIGHALITDALWRGLDKVVQDYRRALGTAAEIVPI